jgi:transcriptional regulator with PAS, ATPase and Fis domain
MEAGAWMAEFGAAITVCDTRGVILEMNEKACETFAEDGGRALVGKSLLDCHPEPARQKLLRLLETRQSNVYTIEKAGVKKLIYQAPWFEKGEHRGLVELSLPIPFELPHFVRDPAPK